MEVHEIENIPGLFWVESLGFQEPFDLPDAWTPLSNAKNSRVVQQYGYTYNYATYNIRVPTDPLPASLTPLQTRITEVCQEYGIIAGDYVFNQCIVNKYEKRQGISAHTDVRAYGPAIACYTQGAPGTMVFRNPKTGEVLPVETPVGSLYVMTGDARYVWTHEMKPNSHKEPRISITFRNVPIGKN